MQMVVGCWAGTPEDVASAIREYELRRGVFPAIRLYALPDGKVFVLILDSEENASVPSDGV
jgi:hypothetical protein